MVVLELSSVNRNRKKKFKANIEILARIANAFAESSSIKKTQLHFASRIRWSSFEKYLNWLTDNNYIEHKIEGKEENYQLTQSGREMFNMALKFHEHVKTSK